MAFIAPWPPALPPQRVGDVAEAEGHHPDLHLTDYRSVRVDVWSHSVGGLTLNDFILAAKIDAVPVDYSPKWLREHPEVQSSEGSSSGSGSG